MKRRRILASSYSKSAISHRSNQKIIKNSAEKLVHFIEQQTCLDYTGRRRSGPIVVRNAFRALQADVFTGFAFSEVDGTNFLDNLTVGPNALEDIGMSMMDLCHDDRRDRFFFWESEKPFKKILRFIKPNAFAIHTKAQMWVSEIISRYESKIYLSKEVAYSRNPAESLETGVYKKLLMWRSPDNGKPLDWNERASEIMDHLGNISKRLEYCG